MSHLEGSEKLMGWAVESKAVPSLIRIVTDEKRTVNLYPCLSKPRSSKSGTQNIKAGFTMLASTHDSLAASSF